MSHHIPGRSEYGCKNRYVVLGRKRKHVINASHLKISEQTLRASGRFRKTSDNKPIPILPSTSTEVDINGNMPLALRRPKRITTTSQQINHNLSEEATTHQETDNHKYAPEHLAKKIKVIKKPAGASYVNNRSSSSGQFTAMLDEISSNRKSSNQSTCCFVCTRPGADIQCDDENCYLQFHKFCLGDRTSSQNSTALWYCPWHYCALCPQAKPQLFKTVVIPPTLSQLAGSSKLISLARYNTSHQVDQEVGKYDTELHLISEVIDATEEKNQDLMNEPDTESPSPYSRCCNCPLALCDKHLSSPSLGQIEITRSITSKGFFACERCAGVSGARFPRQLPRVSLARSLDRVLAAVSTRSENILQILFYSPSEKLVEALLGIQAVKAFFITAKDISLSLGELQRKVRLLSFSSSEDFLIESKKMTEHIAILYERKHPRLAEAVRTLPYSLEQTMRNHASEILGAEQMVKQDELWFQVDGESLCKLNKADSLVGLTPWEGYSRQEIFLTDFETTQNIIDYWNKSVDEESSCRDGKSTLSLLIQSLEAAKLLPSSEHSVSDSLLTSTPTQLQELFEHHSILLRAALKSAAEIRKQVGRVLSALDGIPSEENDKFEPVLTIGGNRLEAEQLAANRSLRAKLDETLIALDLERKARAMLEERLGVVEKKQ